MLLELDGLDGEARVRVRGTLNSRTAETVYELLMAAANSGADDIVIDLTDLCEVTPGGARGLAAAADLLRARGAALGVVGGPARIADALAGLPRKLRPSCFVAAEAATLLLTAA